MAYEPKKPPIWSDSDEERIFPVWSDWCRSKADDPAKLQKWFRSIKVHIDWKTAKRWWNGHAEPGTDRLKQIAERGFPEVITEIVFGAALGEGLALMEQEIEQREQAAQADRRAHQAMRRKMARQSLLLESKAP